jgi:hypothetical protein
MLLGLVWPLGVSHGTGGLFLFCLQDYVSKREATSQTK